MEIECKPNRSGLSAATRVLIYAYTILFVVGPVGAAIVQKTLLA